MTTSKPTSKGKAGRQGKLNPTEQHRRFVETARELGIPETEAAQERAFGKIGLKKPKRKRDRDAK